MNAWQKLAQQNAHVEVIVQCTITKVATGNCTGVKRNAILKNIGVVLNNSTNEIVQEVLELMELTGASEDNGLAFTKQE